eukprot:TRINITY_DN24255_c0_g1_i1.p1 TRINITY_DN24255_c0_g1~~TRINITY_DN24255_c0_g1_i1.p1  ORF type:complete len:158 (+),score=51.20 TRINITY_DN24255_c0_g1_i1:133-606(+)
MCIRDRTATMAESVKEACVAWVNKQIVPLGYAEIADLETGFHDGFTLGGLIEAYSSRKLKLHKSVGITAVRLDNLTICCEFLDHLKLKNRMTMPADFHDGRTKNIVPFILKLDGKFAAKAAKGGEYVQTISPDYQPCLLYTSPSPRDRTRSRMPSSA